MVILYFINNNSNFNNNYYNKSTSFSLIKEINTSLTKNNYNLFFVVKKYIIYYIYKI